jgi:hypothetical protein
LALGFIGQFARRPGINGTPDSTRGSAGEIDTLDDLFSGEGAGRTGAWGIGEHRGNHLAKSGRISLGAG